jgi:hypothetical protein
MKNLETIELLDKFLIKFEYDQVWCSEILFTEIVNKYDFKRNGDIAIDGFNSSEMGTININNRRIEIHLDFSLNSIILKHSNIKKERNAKLNTLHNSSD